MTNKPDEGRSVAEEMLASAQEDLKRITKNLRAYNDQLIGEQPAANLPQTVAKMAVQFEVSLQTVLKLEAKIAEQYEQIHGIVAGGALDLADARTEILGRIAKLRERAGG